MRNVTAETCGAEGTSLLYSANCSTFRQSHGHHVASSSTILPSVQEPISQSLT